MSDTDDNYRQLLSDELFNLSRSESLSEEGLREIIECDHQLRLNNDNHHLVSDYDFFFEACINERFNEEIIECLLEYFPAAASATEEDGASPLHHAAGNENVTPNIMQLLIDAAPDSVRSVESNGRMPLHNLCDNTLEILKLLIEKCPEAVRHVDQRGCLPVHIGGGFRSPEFCHLLIEAYPESDRIADATSSLPLHWACMRNTVATVEYLYKAYPDAINHAATNGHYPIHDAIKSLCKRRDPENAIEIVKFLLECNSSIASQEDLKGRPLLLWACRKSYVNNLDANAAIELIKVICDTCPESVRNEDNNNGRLPIHGLCKAKTEDETVALEILKFLIHRYPESIRHADNEGILPIHLACMGKSPEFCRVLIDAYPGSERIVDHRGVLPLHSACMTNTVATVQYIYKLYPDAINHATGGEYPIHYAILGLCRGRAPIPIAAVEIVEYLLDCDPNVKLQKLQGREPLLYCACWENYNDSNIETGIQTINAIYDAHPEAIEHRRISSDIQRYHPQVQSFINSQLLYARQAKDHLLMMTPDVNGQLPLHTALQNNVRLGSIKLLVKGNPSAIRNVDTNFALPLHVACQHHDSTSVIQYLLGLDRRTLRAVDYDDNTALHYACRGARHEIIAMLLEEYDAVSVSKQNAQKKLPIDLLWESNGEEEKESIEYTESVFRLLKAYPETVMNFNMNM